MTTRPDAATYRLLTWLSPAYPVGAFSYSQGLETAITKGLVRDAGSLQDWLESSLAGGPLWSDAVVFARAHESASAPGSGELLQVAKFAVAFQPTAELRTETMAQGDAFLKTTARAWPCEGLDQLLQTHQGEIAYPVAVACAAAGHGVEQRLALLAWLHASTANLVSAAVRLVPLGQTEGQEIQAAVEPAVAGAADAALVTPLSELATNNIIAEICSMQHEIQTTRLFRS